MPKRNIAIFVVIIIVIIGAIYGLRRIKEEDKSLTLFPENKNINPHFIETINYVTENITNLSPEKAVLGGKWYVTRFGLIDKDHLYVEYEDGHIARRMLIEKDGTDWKVIAFFEPGKDMWQLVYGEDDYMDADLSIYKQSDDLSWELVK